jgi:hypothetical protein
VVKFTPKPTRQDPDQSVPLYAPPVESSSIPSWIRAIANLSNNREIVDQLRENIKPPSTMEVVAKKMNKIYNEFIIPEL